MDKPTLRRELRALSRERLTDELRLMGSASILSQLRQHPLWQQAQHVALYSALPDEPNLRTLIDEVATTKQVYLPRVLDGETMEFFAFTGWQELEQSGGPTEGTGRAGRVVGGVGRGSRHPYKAPAPSARDLLSMRPIEFATR